jgi:hypothetical protein
LREVEKNGSLAPQSRAGRSTQLCYFSAAMALASTDRILRSTHQWLKPLTHVLLSCGITWREFAQLARMTYVEVASENFGKRGRPTNVSRTAILTGLARREVRKQRQPLSERPNTLSSPTLRRPMSTI